MGSTELRTAAQQALEALDAYSWEQVDAARTALRAALAEPDLFHCPKCGGPADNGHDRSIPPSPYWCTKCMAAPLTDEVIAELWHKNGGFHHHFARAIERWLKGNL